MRAEIIDFKTHILMENHHKPGKVHVFCFPRIEEERNIWIHSFPTKVHVNDETVCAKNTGQQISLGVKWQVPLECWLINPPTEFGSTLALFLLQKTSLLIGLSKIEMYLLRHRQIE